MTCSIHNCEMTKRSFFDRSRNHRRIQMRCKQCHCTTQKKIYRKNPEKQRAYKRKYAQENPEKVKNTELWKRFRIRLVDFNKLLSNQKGRCGICLSNKPGGKGTWHVDHDHTTDKVRGLLCHNCNLGLGHFKDDPECCKLAANYLESNAQPENAKPLTS